MKINNFKILNSQNTFFLLMAGSLLFSGCYSYTPPPPAISKDSYTDLTREDKRVIPDDCDILTLKTAVKIALENNPTFREAKASMTAAWARYYQSLSAYLPTVTGTYQLQQSHVFPHKTSNTVNLKQSQVQNQIGLQTNYTIFDGLVRTMNMLESRSSAKQQELMLRDAHRLLISGVKTQFNQILLAKENIRISQADWNFQKKMLKETQIKYDAGAVALTDVLNFQVKANEAENDLINSKYEYLTATYTLAELMGLPDGDIPDEVKFPDVGHTDYKMLPDIGAYLDTALHNRPDLKAYREALKASEYELYSRWGAFSPTVSFFTSYNYNQNRTRYHEKSTPSSTNWYGYADYGGQIQWNLFSGGDRFAAVREAQANLADAEWELAGQWYTVVNEVRSSYEDCIKSAKQLTLFEKTQKLVQQQRDLVEEEYKAGNTELTRLNEAQKDLIRAESNLASAKINVLNSRIQLESVIAQY